MVVSFGPSESIVFNQKSFIIKVLSLSSNVWFIRVIFDCFLVHLEPLMILQALSCMQTTCPLWHSQARWLSTHNLQQPVRNLSTQEKTYFPVGEKDMSQKWTFPPKSPETILFPWNATQRQKLWGSLNSFRQVPCSTSHKRTW